MQAIGTLAGGIAHDFNNILLAIIGNAELTRQRLLAGEKEVLDSIAEIQRAGTRAKELVQRILTFSRPQEHQLRPIRLEPVLKEAVTLLRSTLPAGIDMRMYCAPDVPAVWADASQIHQIIVNLATNASHALEGGGEVEIRLESSNVDASLRQLHQDLQPGPHLHLSVRDTGKGMSEEIAARIFEPFFTTKPPGQGTGLGLSVVHGIVRNHGGAVVVESEPGQGSTFHIYLPATDEEVTAVAAKPASPWECRGKGEHILYLDDEEPLVELAVHFLERLGYRVSGFTLAAEALARFRAAPYAFDLVITDLNMPGSSGMAVAKQLLKIRPDVPVVLASGYVRQSEIEDARALGIREVILKPNTVEEFGPVVQRLLTTRETISRA
jgi:CheY-like chemotaxis protein